MRGRVHSLFVVVAVIATVVIAGPAAAAGPVATSLSVEQWSFEADESIAVTFTLTNTTADTLYVLRWQTPVDGIEANLLQVERDGQPVTYTGRLVKRPAPAAEDYLAIAAGDSFSVVFDPSSAYDMSVRGRYSVSYRAVMHDLRTRSGANLKSLQVAPLVESEPVEMWVEGWRDTPDLTEKKKPGGGGGGQFTNCTTTQQNTLLTALGNATTITDAAVQHLGANPNGDSLYAWWFGAWTSSRFNTVSSHFDALSDAFHTEPITFDCGCNQNYYAYVYPSRPYKIYLCRVFWQAPNVGRDSKAGTLVHETSHFNVVAGTDDYVYGASGAHNLALTDPARAINNADNHEYFAEDQ